MRRKSLDVGFEKRHGGVVPADAADRSAALCTRTTHENARVVGAHAPAGCRR